MEVSYRIGESGNIHVLYEFKENVQNEPWRPKILHGVLPPPGKCNLWLYKYPNDSLEVEIAQSKWIMEHALDPKYSVEKLSKVINKPFYLEINT